MKLQLACADFTFPLLSHDQSMQLISMLGFEGVDIGLFEGRSHLWPSREFVNAEQSATRLRQRTNQHGLRIADAFLQTDPDFRDLAVNHPQPARRQKARDWFLRTLDYATACDCGHVTILPGVHFEEDYERSLARAADELSWRVDQAQARRLTLGIEPHVGSLVADPAPALRLVNSVPGLTLTLDYTHFTRAGLPDSVVEPVVAIRQPFSRSRGAARPVASLVQGERDRLSPIMAAMQQTGYRGWIGIEYVWTDWEHCNECDNLSETILFRDFLRSTCG